MKTSTCKAVKCGQTIGWIRTTAGKDMPVDPVLVVERLAIGAASGRGERVTLITEDGRTVTGQKPEGPQAWEELTQVSGFRPHWSTCKAATMFRERRASAGVA
jgi:hypothetical protein